MSKKIMTKIGKALHDYQMIEPNDKIAIGVSGGKDSLVLAYAMGRLRHYYPVNFDIVAIHLEMGFPDMDFTELRTFMAQENIEYHDIPTQVYEILQKNLDASGRLRCSLCSKFKKALVIEAANNLNCNKVAFAHHGDDAVETLFLNAIFGGKLATFRPKMYMSKTAMTFIRPLVYLREAEITAFTIGEKLPIVKSTCPNDGFTKRQEVKELLNLLYLDYPCAYENFLIMLSNTDKVDLWEKIDD